MKTGFLTLLVVLSGVVLSALEIFGSRMLTPYCGSGIFLDAVLFVSTLATLILGYFFGRIPADRDGLRRGLLALLLFAGIFIMLAPILRRPAILILEPLGLKNSVIAAVLVLFGLPSMFLGATLRSTIGLRKNSGIREMETGFQALLFIAGAVSSAGFCVVVIPALNVTIMTASAGAILIIMAIIGSTMFQEMKFLYSGIGALVILTSGLMWMRPGLTTDPGRGLLDISQSENGEIRVLDTEAGRHLLVNGTIQALVDTSSWASLLHASAVMELPMNYFEHPGEILVIGASGGSIMKAYTGNGWKVECVESDAEVVRICREYFNLKRIDGVIYEEDELQFLRTAGKKYDLVMLSACAKRGSMSSALVTEEIFDAISLRLREGGIFVLDLETIGWNDPLCGILGARLKKVFSEITAFPMEEPPNRFGHVVLIASNRHLNPVREPERNETFDPDWRYGAGYQKAHAWDNQFDPVPGNSEANAQNSISLLMRSDEICRASHSYSHDHFRNSKLSW